MVKPIKILFIDLDGTIREPASGDEFILHPNDQRLIQGAKEAIAHYALRKWVIIGVTNQGGVAAGHKSLEDAKLEQKITLELVPELQHIYFCPSYEGLECWKVSRKNTLQIKQATTAEMGSFRKPGAGMLNLALQFYQPDECWMIGDREEDRLAARAAGINFMWADVWRSRFVKGLNTLDLSCRHISKEILLKFLAT
jgi:D-glycero-D-manno-heptose 1,7-bisphosphate phosphatase